MSRPAPSVAILGAGINGAALARELVLSGVDVTVIDADDIACGATAWSTRLVHGGLRYLEYGEIDLVRESLAERERLCTLAAHLVQPLTFYIPLERRLGGLLAAAARIVGLGKTARWLAGGMPRGSWAVGVGLWLYDRLSGSHWPRHRMLRGGMPGMPQVDPRRYPLGATYVDAQMTFPERFTVELLLDARRAAEERGTRFHVLTHRTTAAMSDGTLVVRPNGEARAAGVDEVLEWRPDAIVNASGAWVDRTREALPMAAGGPRLIGGTQGSHLVIESPGLRVKLEAAGVYAEAADGRPVFVLPFDRELVLVGTTDVPFVGDPAEATASPDEIAYLLDACRHLFPGVQISTADVLLHYSGVRPLPQAGEGVAPGAITRRHLLVRHAGTPVPAWSIIGGKLTTCRSLAESSAQEVLAAVRWPVTGSSRERPLPGLKGVGTADDRTQLVRQLEEAGASPREAARLVAAFGGLAWSLLDESGYASCGWRARLGDGLLAAAVRRAVRDEWALTLGDVVERRLMLAFDPGFDQAGLQAVAAAFAAEGLLSHDCLDAEVARLESRLERRHGRRLSGAGSTTVCEPHEEG
jgi:glycerol-3-phosphate dehydrogenase